MPWTWPLCVKNRFADAPASVPTSEELQDITEVLVAKYDVEFIVPAVKQHLQRLKTSKPLAVYALGIKYGWKDVASSAAKESLKIPLRALGNNAPPELGEMGPGISPWRAVPCRATVVAVLACPGGRLGYLSTVPNHSKVALKVYVVITSMFVFELYLN
ncbi:hypothetical protein B0H16DRAFT_1728486 [Mycena metata]|uniref:Uncharacterized protein n=1 Tax=Mycena metata TaxID=1033252 RepID=A0AAD7IF81_9AGAR|nr:hypothetical protein B0H16DRAFT_1728486 [Mycena metata]